MPIVEIKPGAIDSIIGRPDKAYVTPGLEDIEQGSDAPSGSQILGAAFRQDNTIGSFLSKKDSNIPSQQEDGFDAWSQVKNTPYELHWDSFADTHNQKAFDMRKAQIDQEDADKRTLATAPWYKSVPAQIAAGALDWPSLLPGGAIIRSAKGGVSVLRTAATTGALSGVSAGVQEGALQATQQTRTPEESVNGIGASVILGSLLGAAGGKLLSGAEYRASEEALSRHLMGEAPLTSGDMLGVPREMPPLVSSVKPEAEVAGEVSVAPGEDTIIEPHLSVSGEFELRHGLDKQASEAFGKNGSYEFVDNYEGRRYDDDGGNFGDAVYLDNHGIWTNSSGSGMGRWSVGKVINVKFSPNNGLLVTPETVATIRSKIGLADNEILTPKELKDYANKSGHDSIIIQGFLNNYKNIEDHYVSKYGFNPDNAKKGIRERIPFDELDKSDQEMLLDSWRQTHESGKSFEAKEGEGLDKFVERMKEDGASRWLLTDTAAHASKKINDELAQDQVVVLDKKTIKALGESPKDQEYNGVNFEAGPSTIAAKQQSGDVITGEIPDQISGAVEFSPVHQEIAEVSNILNEAPQAVKEPQTLLAFLKGLGGIKDYKGELKGADIRKRFPGLINNKKGMELDKAREAAAEAGYLGPDIQTAIEKSTPDDLIQKILSDEPVYSALDKDQAYEYRAQQNAKAFEEKVKSAREELDGIAFGTHPDILDDAARIMAYDDVDPFDALEVAAARGSIDYPQAIEDNSNLGEIFDAWVTDNRAAVKTDTEYGKGGEGTAGGREGEGNLRGAETSPQTQSLGTGRVAANDSVQVGTSERVYGAERPRADRLDELRSTEGTRRKLTASERKEKSAERKKLISQANKLIESNRNVLVGNDANKFEELGKKISELGFDLDRELDFSKIKSPEQRQSTLTPATISAIHHDYIRSKPIYMAISEAATGVRQNADTAVDEILLGLSKTVTPQELYDNFAASRDALRAQYGDTIKLYRAEGKQKKKPTKNWATTREFAANFGNNISEVDTPIENIVSATVGPQGNYHEIIVTDPKTYGIDVNAKKVAYELGAEGKPQSVIPGAERISDRALAERRAEAPLKGGNEAPGGMFDQANTDQADIFAQTNIDTKPASVSAAAVLPADLEGNSIAGKLASTIANLSRFPTKGGMTQFNPLLRILHSPSAVVREIGLKLFENPVYLKKNMEGIASEPAAETFMKTWNAGLRRSVEFMNKSYADYAKATSAGPRLTRDQFQEMVGRAMRRGDVSDNRYVEAVAQKWRSDVFNPLKDAAIKAGLLPEDVKVDTATSYFSRMWNRNKLIAQEPKFKRIVKQWIERSMPKWEADFDKETAETITKMTQQGEMFGKAEKLREYEAARIREREERFGIEPGEVSGQIADEVFNTLTGRTEGTARPELIKIQSRGPLKERTFGIPDYWVEEFLEDNIDRVGERYVRMMSADVEMANKFGHLDIEKIKQDINAHYAQLSENAGNEAQRMALDVSRKNDLTDIEGLWDILRGVGSKFSHPWERNFEHVSRLARHYNYIRSMGEASLASLSESVRPAMVHGLVPYMHTMGQLLTNLKGIKMSVEEAKLAGNIAEQALGHRMATMSEISDPYSSLTPTEAVMKNLTSVASVWNGIRILTDWQKSVAAVMTQDRILKSAGNYAKISKSEKAYLAYLGIDSRMAERITSQFKEHGNLTDGVRVAKTVNWKDLGAQRAYYAAINKDVDSIITTSGVADVPLFANTPVGAAMLQFRRFALAAHQRVLLRGLQEDQTRFLGGMIAMASIGMMTTWLKGISGNREGKQPDLSKKPGWWIAEGLDRSGVLAGGMEVANAIEKASGFNPLKTPLQVFDEGAQRQSQRIQNRTLMGAVMGPTVGLVEDINTVAGIPMTMYRGQRIAQGQKNAAERLLPFSSYPFVRQMLRYTVNTPN